LPETLAALGDGVKLGAINDQTRIVPTHFSHNGRMLHEELVQTVLPHGIEVAHDGMRLVI
jgi:phosphoribosyl 1,2-cyclic phosphate phosphodiesterase